MFQSARRWTFIKQHIPLDKFTWGVLFLSFIIGVGNGVLVYGKGAQDQLPYADAVMQVLNPLEYSGMDDVLGEDSSLSVDFEHHVWTLKNAHHFDSKGEILLENKKGGKCGVLVRYVHSQIKPIFPPDLFEIKFAKTQERNYFYTAQATHFVMLIVDKRHQVEYLIDPSFKRYGRRDSFVEYSSFELQDPDVFLRSNKSPDISFGIDAASPLLIRESRLITFSVEAVDGLFDKDHFILAVAATKARSSTSDYVLALRYKEGLVQTTANKELLKSLLTPQEVQALSERLMEWGKKLCLVGQAGPS